MININLSQLTFNKYGVFNGEQLDVLFCFYKESEKEK